jgi:hypothetical protein
MFFERFASGFGNEKSWSSQILHLSDLAGFSGATRR